MLSQEFLRGQGFEKIVYEPDGNIPPDFLCDGMVAVEVRRLNQHHVADGTAPEPLDKKGVSVWDTVRKTLKELGPPTSGRSWWVSYSIKRPVKEFKLIPKLLKARLRECQAWPYEGKRKLDIVDGFSVSLEPSEALHEQEFVLASAQDLDNSGWLLDMMQSNIQLCVDEKAGKISSVRRRYHHWWLVLVDMIGWGLNEGDQEMFRDCVVIDKNGWDRIILIDPRDPNRSFEI